ncbi:hypothetical protein COO60DRAFT_1514267, partial [Scenedesmus sp. NREL 46B-D3]
TVHTSACICFVCMASCTGAVSMQQRRLNHRLCRSGNHQATQQVAEPAAAVLQLVGGGANSNCVGAHAGAASAHNAFHRLCKLWSADQSANATAAAVKLAPQRMPLIMASASCASRSSWYSTVHHTSASWQKAELLYVMLRSYRRSSFHW